MGESLSWSSRLSESNVQHRSRDALGVERPLLATLYGRGNRASTTLW